MAKSRPSGGPGLIGRVVRGVVGLIWGFFWRLGAVMVLIIATATAVFYSGLPPSSELFDGRGVGSVTLRDVDNRIFAAQPHRD